MEWNEVKAKPKKQARVKHDDDDDGGHYGGAHGGHLTAGAVYQGAPKQGKAAMTQHASALADQDFLRDEDE